MKTVSPPKIRPDSQAIKITGTPSEGVNWQFTVQSRASARRFEQVTQTCVFNASHAPAELDALGILAARLVCLDGIRPEQFSSLAASASQPYRCGENIAIEWTEGPHNRIERRVIHPLTLSVWPQAPALQPVPHETGDGSEATAVALDEAKPAHKTPVFHCKVGDLSAPLRHWLRAQEFYVGERDPILALASEQLAWWSEHLPGPLFAHCSGIFVLTAVDRAAWARLETGQALVPDRTPEADDVPEEYQTDKLLEHLDAATGSGFDENMLKLALEVLQVQHPSGIDGLTKRLWIEGLLNLNLSLSGNNPCTVVLVGWICHMCEFGTVSSSNPAASTVRQYASAALLALGQGLKSLESEPADWDPLFLGILYSAICAGKTAGMRAATSAALMSFQGYLETVFDTEQLATAIDGKAGASTDNGESQQARVGLRVQANVLWNHEIAWCLSACSKATDPRTGHIARVMLAIASECAVRHQDLTRLVMANIAFGKDVLGEYCQIEVVHRAGRGRLKTITSQRRLIVRNPASIEIIRDWHELRSRETGNTSAYFLGDKNSDKKRYRPGAVQALLNQLVKRASGCPTMRLHDLRHAVISEQVASALSSIALPDINPLQVVATAAGHAIPLTTLRSYSHLYESSLRLWIDLGLQKALQATADKQAQVFNTLTYRNPPLQGNSLVQAARRQGRAVTDHWLRMLEQHGAAMGMQLASEPFQWADPIPLKTRATLAKPISVVVLADAIARLQRGDSPASVARIAGIEQPLFDQLHQRLDVWVAGVYRLHFPNKTRGVQSVPTLEKRLAFMRVDAGDCGTDFWSAFSRTLDLAVSRDVMRAAVTCWEQHGRGVNIPLIPIAVGRPMLQLLLHAHLARGNIRTMVQSSPPSGKKGSAAYVATSIPTHVLGDQTVIKTVTDLFIQELKFNPYLEAAVWRSDRPMSYLRINPYADAKCTAPTAERTAGLRGWLVAIKARLLLDEVGGGIC
ncbi:MAG: hypothetical protein C0449_05990 [Polaromonas sp.]|nr:hypothetical protein [Polaromonas sp.]